MCGMQKNASESLCESYSGATSPTVFSRFVFPLTTWSPSLIIQVWPMFTNCSHLRYVLQPLGVNFFRVSMYVCFTIIREVRSFFFCLRSIVIQKPKIRFYRITNRIVLSLALLSTLLCTSRFPTLYYVLHASHRPAEPLNGLMPFAIQNADSVGRLDYITYHLSLRYPYNNR